MRKKPTIRRNLISRKRHKITNGSLNNKPAIGMGVYTPPDISLILKIPQKRIRRYITEVWDNRFGKQFNERYSWDADHQKAVNFLVLIEFSVVMALKEMGHSTRAIFKARESIGKENGLAYPFAHVDLLAHPKHIWYEAGGSIYDADGSGQTNFSTCVKQYCRKLSFGSSGFAEQFWPDGKQSSIVIDPRHQFGQPVIHGTNILTDTIFAMHEAGDPVPVLSKLYDISEKNVLDVVAFHNKAA